MRRRPDCPAGKIAVRSRGIGIEFESEPLTVAG
jgi:hypothetical protein